MDYRANHHDERRQEDGQPQYFHFICFVFMGLKGFISG